MGFFKKLVGKGNDDLGMSGLEGDLGKEPEMPGINNPMSSPEHDMGLGIGQDPLKPDNSSNSYMPPIRGQAQPKQEDDFSPFGETPTNKQEINSGFQSKQQQLNEVNMNKDLEIISAKLDAIKAELDSMNQRMRKLERIAEGESTTHKDKWGY